MTSYYAEVREIPKMTQDDLVSLYEQEGIYKTDLDLLIREAKQELSKLNKKLKYVGLSNGLSELGDSAHELFERRKVLGEQLSKLNHKKCYRFINSMSTIVRTYPSQELINSIVEVHLYLAYNLACKYVKKLERDRSKHSFDDLYQSGAEALMHAAKQYVPGGTATFVTYARKCIENRLSKEIYGEKKKKTIKVDFLTLEYERMLLARNLLLNLSQENIFIPDEDSISDEKDDFFAIPSRRSDENKKEAFKYFFKVCNKDIRKFNKKMARCFEETMPRIKEEHPIKDLFEIYRRLVSRSLIDKVLTEEDEWIIRQSFKSDTTPSNKAILMRVNRIDYYLHKLVQIKETLRFEKEYMKSHDGVKPSEEEIYAYLAKRIRETNNFLKSEDGYFLRKFHIDSLETYNSIYYSNYRIRKGLSGEEQSEIEEIYREFEEKYKTISEKEKQTRTEEEESFLVTYCSDEQKDARKYIYEVLKKRKKDTGVFLHQENIKVLDRYQVYGSLLPRISRDDVKSVCKSIAVIQSLDEFEKERGNRARSTILTPEEQMIENETSRQFKDAISKLPNDERKIIELLISCDGINNHTTKEISEILGIDGRSVVSLKNKGLRKLRKNNKLDTYLREPNN